MNPIRYTLKELKEKTVPIGREGENEYTVVSIDCAEVYEEHPEAVASMKVQNPNKVIYPVVIERSGNDIIWTVKASDLTVKGDGRFQLTFTEGTVIHKTVIGRTLILKSLVADGPVPEAVEDWIDEATELMEDMEEKRDSGYFKGDPGDPGAPGHSPVLTADKVGKTTTIYSDGTQLAQILDGQDGQAGAIIDDTTPAADKVFSSSKVNGELNTVKSAIQDKASAIVNIVSGNVISFNDGADNAKIMSMIAEIKATQSGTGTASPINVRWINGFTGLTIYQSDEDKEHPTTFPVSWESVAGTIYMGTINFTLGLITVTHAYKRYTGASDENWVMTNDGLTGVITWLEVRNLQRLNGVTLCNMSPPNEEWQTPPAYGLVINNASSYNIRASVITEAMTANQFKTWLSTHNLELVCPLTTPVTYQIDPVTVNTLLGVNNIWVNTGAITELKYKADTKEYINTSDILLQKIIGKKTFSIFKKVCCIGDSLMNGYIMGSDGVARNDMAYSWVKYMETMTGADYVNCGISGANTRTWLTSENGLAKAQIAANKAQAYIIGLQINDANIGMDVGTVSDIGTDADTYFGHTSKIIDEVFTINNDAHVFLLNQPKNYTGSHTPYMKAIEDIADYYQNNGTHEGQVHLISLLDEIDLFMSAGCADSKADGHYTPVGYEFVAEIMMFALSKYMNEHPMLFQDVNLIPYGS